MFGLLPESKRVEQFPPPPPPKKKKSVFFFFLFHRNDSGSISIRWKTQLIHFFHRFKVNWRPSRWWTWQRTRRRRSSWRSTSSRSTHTTATSPPTTEPSSRRVRPARMTSCGWWWSTAARGQSPTWSSRPKASSWRKTGSPTSVGET